MKAELAKLDAVNEKAEAMCQVEFVEKRVLKKEDKPYGNGVLGYRVHGTDPECQWMAIQEPKYVDIMRKIQEDRAIKVMEQRKL